MSRPDLTLAREFEAALAWWQAAGVDCDFTDDATAWLADKPLDHAPTANSGNGAAPRKPSATPAAGGQSKLLSTPVSPPVAEAPTVPRRVLLGDSPTADLAAFQQWWMEAPDLDTARGFPRIMPRGPEGAALMVLVPHPEPQDSDRLLSGPQGRLLDNILAAMGLDGDAVYIASALPSHTPMADLGALAAGGMDAVTVHHVGLVAPARVLAMGNGLAAMLGASPDQPLREINHAGRNTPAIASETLDALMEMPRLKARFWRRWMEWSAIN